MGWFVEFRKNGSLFSMFMRILTLYVYRHLFLCGLPVCSPLHFCSELYRWTDFAV